MILSGKEIERLINEESIVIEPFDSSKVNPNSYNLTLHNELLVYKEKTLDMKKQNDTESIVIPNEGLLLEPGKLYLGRTVERTFTNKYVPMLEGRSSVGRLGVSIHVTAGFGDIGFNGYWTLEITVTQPTIIYPWVDICQIYYHTIQGDYDLYDSDKYQHNTGIQASLMYIDFEKLAEQNTPEKNLWSVCCYNYAEQGYCKWGIEDGNHRKVMELDSKEIAKKICEAHNQCIYHRSIDSCPKEEVAKA